MTKPNKFIAYLKLIGLFLFAAIILNIILRVLDGPDFPFLVNLAVVVFTHYFIKLIGE